MDELGYDWQHERGELHMKNEYLTLGDVTLIYLTQNQIAIIDTDNLDTIRGHTWHAKYARNTRSFYALSTARMGRKYHTYYMHRELCGAGIGEIVDHLDHNTLNNTSSNIIATNFKLNNRNRKRNLLHGNKYRCVYIDKGLFKVDIKSALHDRYFGMFSVEKQAAWIADFKMRELGYSQSCYNLKHTWKGL